MATGSTDRAGRGPRYGARLALVIGTIALYRLWVVWNSPYTLYPDEAYYFGWAQDLAAGYYSKPPLIAWVIALTTGLCGDAPVCVRLGALLIHPLSAGMLYLLVRRIYGARTAFWSALTFFTLPAISLSSQIISTDVLLLCFWVLALYGFVRALESGATRHWLTTGLAGGLGLMSKYTMGIFAVSALGYLLADPIRRRRLREPGIYLAAGVALLVFTPNIVWNWQNGFATVVHTAQISHLGAAGLHWRELAEFLAGQLLVFGPLCLAWLLYLALVRPAWARVPHAALLWWFALPFLAIISAQALAARAHLNWAVPAYVTATVLAVVTWSHTNRRAWLAAALAVNVVLGLVIHHFDAVAGGLGIRLSAATDPYKRMRGWDRLGRAVQAVYRQHPDLPLLAEDRRVLAELIYYMRPHPFDAVMWNPLHAVRNQYDLTTDMNRYRGGDFIYVTDDAELPIVSRFFESVERLKVIHVPIHDDFALVLYVYHLKGFRGY